MPSRFIRWFAIALLGLGATAIAFRPMPLSAQEITRKVKSRVSPSYPDLARRMMITGVVKVAVVVSPNGSVKSTKVIGGHPLLCDAAVDAVKKWKFEPASDETSGIVEFKFQPEN